MDTNLKHALEELKKSKHIIAFTGAGISQESGIPTFRGSGGGFWRNFRLEEVATPQAFLKNPRLVWDFYLERRKLAKEVQPNAAHKAFAAWEKIFPFVGVVTQNIDGLHEQAGSRNIQELHGSLWRSKCSRCGKTVQDLNLTYSELPHCRDCGGLMRPDIVWFGEELNPNTINQALEWMRKADLIFVIGTSGVVEPAASFVRGAKRYGAFIAEVNVEETALTYVADLFLRGKSSEIFSSLSEAITQPT
ncbi:MAG: NAD-dependent deacylase [Candidatus Omnitrophica bacterium]|nr:NAD-dependent deacylase [Candidatus Omnitrophota bacterium]